MKRADIIAGILGLALASYVFYTTTSFPEDQVVRVGPAFFPRLLSVGLAIFSIILLISAFTKTYTKAETGFSLKDKGIQRAIISVVATVIYCLFLEYLGFITCSIIYLLFLMFLLNERKYFQMVATSICVTGAVFLLFRTALNITLPLGGIYGF